MYSGSSKRWLLIALDKVFEMKIIPIWQKNCTTFALIISDQPDKTCIKWWNFESSLIVNKLTFESWVFLIMNQIDYIYSINTQCILYTFIFNYSYRNFCVQNSFGYVLSSVNTGLASKLIHFENYRLKNSFLLNTSVNSWSFTLSCF